MWEIINGFHDNPETYVWAVLVAFAIYAVVFVIPNSFDKHKGRKFASVKLRTKMHQFAKSSI
jgi:hypothetical protein